MMQAFITDPNNIQKRLGDGFYEQRLIREQVVALTGQRYIGDTQSDEEQYKMLMDNGIAFGQLWGLKPGVALTPEQMSTLTSDIVWMVSQTVQLPDGSTQQVLVPQVYAKVKAGDLDGSGALLAGRNVNLNLSGDLTNSGRINSKDSTQILANNINNLGGIISGNDVALQARTDINNIGGTIKGGDSLLVIAGRDINVTTTTRSAVSTDGNFGRTSIDRIGSLSVTNDGGFLGVQAGRDVNLTAAQVTNSGSDSQISVTASNNLNLSSLASSSNNYFTAGGRDWQSESKDQQVGTTILGGGDISLRAGHDMNITASDVSAGDNLHMQAGNNISIAAQQTTSKNSDKDAITSISSSQGSNISAGANLGMQAGNDISITAQQTTSNYSERGFNTSTTGSQGSSITAGDNLGMQAGHNLTLESSTINADNSATLIAGNDLNLNAGKTSENSRNGNSESHSTGISRTTISSGGDLALAAGRDINSEAAGLSAGGDVAMQAERDVNLKAAETSTNSRNGNSESHSTDVSRTTISSGGDLALAAGRDINSEAAGLAAEGNVAMQAGRDVNLLAAETTEGDSYRAKKKVEINESVRQQSTEIASGGNTTIVAGRDVNSQAAQVIASGDIGVVAGRDINLSTATESDYHFKEETKTKKGFLNKTTTHTIEEDSATREAGTLLSGDNVTLVAGNNLLVNGSAVVGDGNVSLNAGNNIDVVAATDTDSTYRLKEKKKSGLMGSGGIGFTIGSAKSRSEMNDEGTTQSQSFSTVGSTGGNVSMNAGKQVHIGGADVIAGKDISLSGDSVLIEPGRDQRTHDESFEQKQSGLTLALSGSAGSAINSAVSSAQSAKDESDGRLAALKGTQAILSGEQVNQAVQMDAAKGGDTDNTNTVGVTLSYGSQSSKSSSHSEQNTATGSTLNAGDNLSVTAKGGDITVIGSQIKAGQDVLLDAAKDINLVSSQDMQQLEGKNKSSGGSVGIGIGVGSGGWGITVSASGNSSKGKETGNGTQQNETTIDAGRQVTIKSGNDTTLAGAQVSGNKVVVDVGNNLTISSLQDSDRYDSKQQSVSGGASFTFGSMTGSGSISFSKDKMHSNYDSVIEQSGIYAGSGGFDITVGNHTQLDGAVIASTATADKNHLNTGTLGFTDIGNKAEYEVSHVGGGFSSGGSYGSQFAGNAANNLLVGAGGSDDAEGTTHSAISEGSITIRDKDNQKQDVADLSRDVENANGSISPIFDKEKEQKRLEMAQVIGELGSQAADVARTQGDIAAINGSKAELAKQGIYEPGKGASKEEWEAYNANLAATDSYKAAQKAWGTGSDIQQGIGAATMALQGLAGGDLKAALAGGAAPYLAELVKNSTSDDTSRVIAHAVVNAALAAAQGKNAVAGAAGAATGELVGIIALSLYGTDDVSKLGEPEKQKISALAAIASALAGGLIGDNSADAMTGAIAGKTTVENNALSVAENKSRSQEMAQCQGSSACENGVIDKYKKINAEQRESVIGCKGAQECVDKANEVGKLQADYANRANELLEKSRNNGGLSPAEQDELAILQVTTIQLEADRNAAIHNALMSGDSPEAKQLAINSLAQVAGTSAAGIAAGVGKGGKGSSLPTPTTTSAANGLNYQSNPKHTPGQQGYSFNAGTEPKNSIDLFGASVASGKKRYSIDSEGNVHQFTNTNDGTWHWSGSTGDKTVPLKKSDIPNSVKKEFGLPGKWR